MEYFGVSGDIPNEEYIELLGDACVGIGIPYSMYWHGTSEDNEEISSRIRAYLMMAYADQRYTEEKAWIMGQYMAMAIGEAFNDKKSIYPNKPFEFYLKGKTQQDLDDEKELERERQIKKEQAQLETYLANFM